MDHAALLYDPIYETFGVPATLTPNRPDATGIAVTVIERTTSTDASEEFDLNTVRPGAFVRRCALDEAGIASAELDGGTLAFGGRTWRIDAHATHPGLDGESSGEVLLHLIECADG
jgi:hypothetical protein